MRPFRRSRPHSLRADAVVTGAGSGLGRAFCRELARRGGRVVCADRDEAGAAETVRLVRNEDGGDALAVTCDVTGLDQVRALAGDAADFFSGPPTLVVNNAGIGAGGPVIGGPDDDLADWHATHDVNFWGVVHGCHVFVPLLRAAGRGGVINVASAAAFAAAPRMGAYSTSKAAVLALSETLAAETAGSGVTVSVLCPTFVRTGILGSGRIDPATSALATRIMAATGRAPETVVRRTLDAHDRGRLHVLPQVEGRLTWAVKRAVPGLYTRDTGLGARLATRML
ncbi:MAG: SDR family NAD(P)-dependent oxidoreductase, partial [Pseudonocardia sediminis]